MFARKHRKTGGRRLADLRGPGLPMELLLYAFLLGTLVGIWYMRREES